MVNAACLPFGQPWSILGPALAAAAGAVHVAIGVAVASLASIFFNLGRAGAAEAAGGLGFNSRDCRKQSHRCEQSNAERAHGELTDELILQIPGVQVKKWQAML